MHVGLVFSASKMQNEFHEASLNTGLQVNVENHVWTPLEKDTLKLNVDAAFSLNSKIGKFGMVVRDSSCKVCLCGVSSVGNVESTLHAELKAILWTRGN